MSNAIVPVSAAGVPVTLDGYGWATLVLGTTYYFELRREDSASVFSQSFHAQWDAAIILTGVVPHDTNQGDATAFSPTTAGLWIPENTAGAVVPTINGTLAASTISTAGGTAGGAVWNLNLASARQRLAVVVGATGGKFRVTGNVRLFR